MLDKTDERIAKLKKYTEDLQVCILITDSRFVTVIQDALCKPRFCAFKGNSSLSKNVFTFFTITYNFIQNQIYHYVFRYERAVSSTPAKSIAPSPRVQQAFVDKKDSSMTWLQQGEDMLNELLKFPGEDKSDEKLLMTVKMQKNMETQLNTLAWLVTESERLLGGAG